ncbi:MAG: hypothetical protein Q9166_005889 [cf. Caloplaca sp. 2 TL-2023]
MAALNQPEEHKGTPEQHQETPEQPQETPEASAEQQEHHQEILEASAAPKPGPPKGNDDERKALQLHNQARQDASRSSGHGRPDLKWDDNLAKQARAYAQHLANANKGLQHSSGDQRPGQGENLYWSKPNGSLEDASKGWLSEKKNYHGEKIGQGNFASFGHYTQCIWPTTTKVGLGMHYMLRDYLTALPDELLLPIIRYLKHGDLGNFSGCCKHVHRVSDAAMTQHLQNKRHYLAVAVGDMSYDYENISPGQHPVTLIMKALDDDGPAEYNKELTIGDTSVFKYKGKPTGRREKWRLGRLRSRIDSIRPRLTFIPYHHSLDTWAEWLIAREPNYIILLMDLLPSMERLKLVGSSARDVPYFIEYVVKSTVSSMNAADTPFTMTSKIPPALRFLKEVTLVGLQGFDVELRRLYSFASSHTIRANRLTTWRRAQSSGDPDLFDNGE